MTGRGRIAWDESMTRYDFGRAHPMAPVRLDLTMRLAGELGLLDGPGAAVVSPPVADDAELLTVHTADYIAAVRRCAADPSRAELRYGLGTEDNPCFPGMHEATARVVGASASLARAVWAGEVDHGVNIAGGLHHAMPDRASGFCVYNDVAVAIRALRAAGAERIAYVDLDVHHGDGVQEVFYDDPNVLTISLHESPRSLFPGTGLPEETGGRGAEGASVNVALPPGTDDARWLRAFNAVVPPVLRHFKPQVLVSQHGCDSHLDDPLAHLALTVDGQRAAAVSVHELAHELCGGRWIAAGGGGYSVVDVVPRSWSHLIGIATGRPVDPATPVPAGWRDYVAALVGRGAPVRMGDGGRVTYVAWETGYDPGDPLDRAVMASRTAAFPFHGLDPHR
jgi:acetoin utilization protein AcuC